MASVLYFSNSITIDSNPCLVDWKFLLAANYSSCQGSISRKCLVCSSSAEHNLSIYLKEFSSNQWVFNVDSSDNFLLIRFQVLVTF